MCGRFTITLIPAELEDELDISEMPEDFVPRYNVAPTQPVAVCRDYAAHKAEWMRWGLVPAWAKDPSIGVRMINARSETLLEKPSFRSAFLKRRCLILADGFYEWQKIAGKGLSIPHYFFLKDKKPFFFAGLWDQWQPSTGDLLTTCTIITGAANELVQPIHERMPMILTKEEGWKWLNPEASRDKLQEMLHPFPSDAMAEHIVSTSVNQSGIELPALISPV